MEQQTVSSQNHKRKNVSGTVQTFVDNKRKQIEKKLSVAKHDQMFLKLAKDELKMKEAMVASFGGMCNTNQKSYG